MIFNKEYRSLLMTNHNFRTVGIKLYAWFLFIPVLCSGLYGMAVAQRGNIHFERFTDEEGLPSNLFRKIIQDREGRLWMAGMDGLTRYDGYTIETFRHSHFDTTSLSGNNITNVYEDSKGRLWVATQGAGLNLSDETKTHFRKVRYLQDQKELQFTSVSDFTEDSTGHIWLATGNGLFVLAEQEGSFISIPVQEITGSQAGDKFFDHPSVLYCDTKGNVWIGTTSGLYMVDHLSKRLYTPQDFGELPFKTIQDIAFDRKGNLWITCQQMGTRIFYAAAGTHDFKGFHPISFPSAANDIYLAFDLDNRMWVSVFADQALGYDFRDSTLFFQSKTNNEISHERFFRKPLVDRTGNTWIPVEGFYIYPYPKGFNTFLHPYLFHQSNTSIYGMDSILWLAYREKGLVRLNRVTGTTTYYSKEQDSNHRIPVNHIQDVLKVHSGNLILVGFGNVAVMNPKGHIIASYPINGTQRAAFEDSKGRIWIGGYQGLQLFSETKGLEKTYSVPGMNAGEGQFIQTIVEDAQGNLWFASDLAGLTMLNPESEKITRYRPVEGDPNSIPSLSVLDLAIDSHQRLWLATDVALVKFDPSTSVFRSYGRSEGLQNDYISAVICTSDGMVWMSTHGGISSFDPDTEQFENYSVDDGLSNVSFYTRSKFDDGHGTLFFGGKKGVDYFRPKALRRNPTPPIMLLTGITINNQRKLSSRDLDSTRGAIQLSYKDRMLEIEMAGLHFIDQDAVRYEYRMDGVSKDWIDLGHQRKVLFTSLASGDYTFHARAWSGDRVVSEKELILPIHVAPPFYETIWFQSAGLGLLAILFYSLVKVRERIIKNKEKREAEVSRKLAELEKRALQAQMNPHFIYNSMNSIQQFMILHDIEGAMKYLTKFSRILRSVLTLSSQSRIPLYDEINMIEDYLELENMRFPNKFSYTIHVAPEINIHTVEIPPFFIQPQVENAIRHGLLRKATPGHLRIEMKAIDNHLQISVEDDGIGREAAQAMKSKSGSIEASKGLSIVEERLAHLHFEHGYKPFKIIDLYDDNHRPAGTRVEISLPLD